MAGHSYPTPIRAVPAARNGQQRRYASGSDGPSADAPDEATAWIAKQPAAEQKEMRDSVGTVFMMSDPKKGAAFMMGSQWSGGIRTGISFSLSCLES